MAGDRLFPVGHPAGKDDVVDREAFIDEVVTRLLSRNSVVLAAPRRVGKTSVAQEALQRQQHTAYLFLGSQANLMAQLFGARKQPFFRFGTWLDLPPVPDEAWRSFIRMRLSEHGIRIDDAGVDAILDYTGGHPSDTMEVAQESYLAARRRRLIDGHLARAACAAVQERAAPLFDLEVDLAGPRARALLGRIANGQPLFEGERSRDAPARALRELARAGFVRRTGHGRYEITEPMLAHHLRRPR